MRERTLLGAGLIVMAALFAAWMTTPQTGSAQRGNRVQWRVSVISSAEGVNMRIFDIPGRTGAWSPPDDVAFSGWRCRVGDVILVDGKQERSLRCRLPGAQGARVAAKSFCNPRHPAESPIELSLRSGDQPRSRVILECVAN